MSTTRKKILSILFVLALMFIPLQVASVNINAEESSVESASSTGEKSLPTDSQDIAQYVADNYVIPGSKNPNGIFVDFQLPDIFGNEDFGAVSLEECKWTTSSEFIHIATEKVRRKYQVTIDFQQESFLATISLDAIYRRRNTPEPFKVHKDYEVLIAKKLVVMDYTTFTSVATGDLVRVSGYIYGVSDENQSTDFSATASKTAYILKDKNSDNFYFIDYLTGTDFKEGDAVEVYGQKEMLNGAQIIALPNIQLIMDPNITVEYPTASLKDVKSIPFKIYNLSNVKLVSENDNLFLVQDGAKLQLTLNSFFKPSLMDLYEIMEPDALFNISVEVLVLNGSTFVEPISSSKVQYVDTDYQDLFEAFQSFKNPFFQTYTGSNDRIDIINPNFENVDFAWTSNSKYIDFKVTGTGDEYARLTLPTSEEKDVTVVVSATKNNKTISKTISIHLLKGDTELIKVVDWVFMGVILAAVIAIGIFYLVSKQLGKKRSEERRKEFFDREQKFKESQEKAKATLENKNR